MKIQQAVRAMSLGLVAVFASGCSESPDPVIGTSGMILSAVPEARCGAGSLPETGLQGQVPLEDRQSGRNEQGYRCNLELVGQYQGEGGTWVNPSYLDCVYMGTAAGGLLSKRSQGVQVVDVSNRAAPVFTTNLTSTAMLIGAWESLRVNESRGLLAAVAGGPVVAGAFFDIYDVTGDCSQPRLQNSFIGNLTLPANFLGHEGNFSPDGRTYWSTGFAGGALTAIDVSDPTRPRILYVGLRVLTNHGFEFSPDGNRMYLSMALPAGVAVLDISDIQSRQPIPTIRQVGSVFWNLRGIGQHTLPITYQGRPYLIAVDEWVSESYKVIDMSDETNPRVVGEFSLQINRPEHARERARDVGGNGFFGYESHYCTVDRPDEPTALACGHFQSGIRVFDIRNLLAPREIAYYNPPAQVGNIRNLQGSEHAALASGATLPFPLSDLLNLNVSAPYLFDPVLQLKADLSADWCSSPPRFIDSNQLLVTCQDNGVMVLRFTNGAYPVGG